MKTVVIAEAGVNHNGDLALAKKLIDAAADAGADIVKFQTFRADLLVTPTAAKAEYQTRGRAEESQHAMLRRLELSRGDQLALIEHCRRREIVFFSTAFDLESLDELHGLGLGMFKVPSGELTNLPYLRRVASFGRPIIMSTGMATLSEVKQALKALEEAGANRDSITVLHCTTDYPARMEDVNLRAMMAMGQKLGVKVGYSDHTRGNEISIAAVALGASMIEKHFTCDRSSVGPDHAASLEPGELKQMVAAIRNVEKALGDGRKAPAAGEEINKVAARKSLVAKCSIKAGEVFSPVNVTAKRPGSGLSPMRWDEVMGRKASRDFAENDLIEL